MGKDKKLYDSRKIGITIFIYFDPKSRISIRTWELSSCDDSACPPIDFGNVDIPYGFMWYFEQGLAGQEFREMGFVDFTMVLCFVSSVTQGWRGVRFNGRRS